MISSASGAGEISPSNRFRRRRTPALPNATIEAIREDLEIEWSPEAWDVLIGAKFFGEYDLSVGEFTNPNVKYVAPSPPDTPVPPGCISLMRYIFAARISKRVDCLITDPIGKYITL